jgi:predicted AlkP superfamily phosphohydrolase/phosphomutase
MKKTLIAVLDAACWEYLDPLLQSGRLPIMQQLIDAGTRGELRSTMPAWTPAAWGSIVTGKNPGKHGVFDMRWLRPGTYDFLMMKSRVRMGVPFWQRLNQQGIRVGLVNVPFIHPPDPVDGFIVTGFGTPTSVPDITYPQDIKEWIENQFGPYEPWLRFETLKNSSAEEKIIADIKHQENQVLIAEELAGKYQVDVLLINLMVPDHANHLLPKMEQIENAICRTDEHLGMLLQSFQPDNVVVMSDHGSRRVKGDFFLHHWLRDQGYCVQRQRTRSERSDALNWILFAWFKNRWGLSGIDEKIIRSIVKRFTVMMPDRVNRKFWNMIEASVPFARQSYLFSEKLDFVQSKLYYGSPRSGLLYFNLVGRDPDGVIPPEEKPTLSAEVTEKLQKIVDPDTGQSLFTNVYSSEELYKGPALDHAPDLVLDFYDSNWNALATFGRGSRAENLRNKYFVSNWREFGHHSRDGIFIFTGPDFGNGSASHAGHVMDIPATLLYLYNVPIPEDYDGRVMTEAMAPELIANQPISYQPGEDEVPFSYEDPYSDEQTEELEERLRMLGYLD